jgi:hypothetical protein
VRSQRQATILSLVVLALVPTLLFADVLTGVHCFFTRDITNYYYPAKSVLRSIVLNGEFPYWNPFFSAGQPLAANPEHEVFYPLTWLILLPRFDLAFHFLIVLHLIIVLLGTFALLRSMRLGHAASVLGAISFGVGGAVLSTIDLLPILFSVAWMPWTCLFARRALQSGSLRDHAWASTFLGIQLLVGEPATAIQTGMLLGMYALHRALRQRPSPTAILRKLGSGAALSIGALCIAAVQVLPALDHFKDSVRSRGLDFYLVGYWSAPLPRLAEIVFANLIGSPRSNGAISYWLPMYAVEQRPFLGSIYGGLLVAILFLAGLLLRSRGAGLASAIVAVSVLFAAGRHTPLLHALYASGIASWLRYPEKFLIAGVFAMAIFASVVLDRLFAGDPRVRNAALAATSAVTASAIFFWVVAFASHATDEQQRGWLLASLRGAVLVALLWSLTRVRARIASLLFCAFVLADLFAIVPRIVERMPARFLRDSPSALKDLPAPRDAYRLFHQASWNTRHPTTTLYRPYGDMYWASRNALAPMMPAEWGIHTVLERDYDRTQLLPTADFTDAAWDLASRRPSDWGDVIASMSNVWYVGIHRSPEEAVRLSHGDPKEIQPVRFVARSRSPRYYFAERMVKIGGSADFVRALEEIHGSEAVACVFGPAFAPAPGTVRTVSETASSVRMDVEAQGRAFLIMSVTPHKYWTITVDGQETPSVVTNIGYQGIEVPAGRHAVAMQYRNPLIAAGAAVSAATILSLVLIGRRRYTIAPR